MRETSDLERKAAAFALGVIAVCGRLRRKRGALLATQLLRSGTSVGANIAEGKYAQSRRDYIAKHGIALKEASESYYWLNILFGSGLVTGGERFRRVRNDCEELIDLLLATIETARRDEDWDWGL